MYQLSIEIPEHIELDKRPRPLLVKFKSQEEKDVYVQGEYRYTQDALKKLNAAWSKHDRTQAFLFLYGARKAFHDSITHRETPKEIA